jgi:hypothetical protein
MAVFTGRGFWYPRFISHRLLFARTRRRSRAELFLLIEAKRTRFRHRSLVAKMTLAG